jgi:hypothetical protein
MRMRENKYSVREKECVEEKGKEEEKIRRRKRETNIT